MHDALKKMILYTVGAYHLSKESLEKLIAELEEEGAFNKEEGERMVKEALDVAADRTSKLRSRISEEVTRVLDEAGMTAAQRQDVEEKVTDAVMGELESDKEEE